MQRLIRSYSKPEKPNNLLAIIRECIKSGKYCDTMHSEHRRRERNIGLPELIHVLNTGRHEKGKDCFDTIFGSWNYSIRGITLDKKELRVIVSFDKDTHLLLITAFYLGREN